MLGRIEEGVNFLSRKMIDQSVEDREDDLFPFAGLLDREDLVYLGRLVEWQSTGAGECLWRAGDRDDRLAMVVQGRVKLLKETETEGRPLLVGLFGPGSLVMDFAVEEGLPRETSAYSVEPSEIVFLPRPQFEKVLSERPELGHRIFNEALISLGEQLRHAYRRLAVFF